MAQRKPSHQARLDSFRTVKRNQETYYAQLRRKRTALGAAALVMLVITCALIGEFLAQGGIA